MLHFCYQTEPMLNAAPGELLDFSVVVNQGMKIEPDDVTPITMTDRQKKKRKAQINEINKNLRKKLMPVKRSRFFRILPFLVMMRPILKDWKSQKPSPVFQ